MDTRNDNPISPESLAIAARVDQFPPEVRAKLRDALMRIADVYRAQFRERKPAPTERQHHDPMVITFPGIRRSRRKSTRAPNRCPDLLGE